MIVSCYQNWSELPGRNQAEPGGTRGDRTEPSRTKRNQAEPGGTRSGKAEPDQTGLIKAEQGRTVPNQARMGHGQAGGGFGYLQTRRHYENMNELQK